MNKGAIFPLFYLPPIEYFHQVKNTQQVIIERFEHFPKQTYRNRASIHSANGKLDLIVPVLKGASVHTQVKDVRISYDFDWQRLHWLSLQASYRSSAYFEFYEHEFARFFESRFEYLFEYNLELLSVLLRLLKMNISLSFTDSYQAEYDEFADFRANIHPKMVSQYQTRPYFQVFEDRNGFMPNLSIVDLLFNQGPRSGDFL